MISWTRKFKNLILLFSKMSFSDDNSIDWESVLGLPKDSIDDDIKGTDELSLSNKLYKVPICIFFDEM